MHKVSCFLSFAISSVTFKNYDDTEYATKDVFYNGKVDKPEGTPTRGEGYLFKYWTLDNAVEGQKKEYSFDTPVVGNLVLYPVFIETFTVSFDCGKGVENVPKVQTVEYGKNATKECINLHSFAFLLLFLSENILLFQI